LCGGPLTATPTCRSDGRLACRRAAPHQPEAPARDRRFPRWRFGLVWPRGDSRAGGPHETSFTAGRSSPSGTGRTRGRRHGPR
jgi:hypothetical protein